VKKFLAILALAASGLVAGWLDPDLPILGVAAEKTVVLADAIQEGPGAMERAAALAEKARPKKTYYQYTDGSGAVRFAEKREDIPEAWRASAGTVAMEGPPPTNPGEARAARAAMTARVQAEALERTPVVIVYTAAWHEGSQKMLAWLDKHEIEYENRDVDEMPRFFQELQDKTGSTSVPAWEIDGKIQRGFSARSFKRAYEKARKVS
jgi:glutaredoxin